MTFCSVQKCSIAKGGCDDSAICTNPTTAGGDVVCSCAAGEQFASDGRTCTSTADAEKYCPTSTCWTYEMVEGSKKCVMKRRVWNWKFYQSAARSEKSAPRRPVIYNQLLWCPIPDLSEITSLKSWLNAIWQGTVGWRKFKNGRRDMKFFFIE